MMSRRQMEEKLAEAERKIVTFKRVMRATHAPWPIEDRAHCRTLKDEAKAIRVQIAERFSTGE